MLLGFGPLGVHNLYPLLLAVTCMEQLNPQKLFANRGKPQKLSAGAFAALLWCSFFCSFSDAPNETLFLFLLRQFHPPVNLMHDWEGTMSAWRGKRGEEGKEMDTPLVSLLSFPGPCSRKCEGSLPLPKWPVRVKEK